MAKLVVTSTANSIKVVFNDYASAVNTKNGTWRKDHIKDIKQDETNGNIYFDIANEQEWVVSFDGGGGSFQIDTVDAVAPTDNDDLYTKLIALIA